MSVDETWASFFKSEVQVSGAKLFAQQKISISSGSDTGIHAFVKLAPPFKVYFAATDIASESFSADCTCPAAKKGRFCKHIWATLLAVAEDYPDFLSSKRMIEKPEASVDAPADSKKSFQAAANLRASEYRKEQYQKQKLRAKELKRPGSTRVPVPEAASFPPEIETALGYFSDNGFAMLPLPTEAVVGEAKRRLSRVFHPDRGGSHDEITELNRNSELVLRFLRASTL